MSSRWLESCRRTAAWRLGIPTTVAFAVGTALAFAAVYVVVDRGVAARADDWLVGESRLLAEVVQSAPAGDTHERLLREVAELAEHEVWPQDESGGGERPVFFLVTTAAGQPETWVGPRDRQVFLDALHSRPLADGVPESVAVAGWDHPYRVVARAGPVGGRVLLGFLDLRGIALRQRVARTFAVVWGIVGLFGLVLSCFNARRILRRVERITAAATTLGSRDLHRRLPGAAGEDEIARLAATFNGMLDRIEGTVRQIRAVTDGVAHDLRSPVTAVRGNLELALTRGDDRGLREAAAAALEGLDRLRHLIDTTLDVAEAEAGALALEREPIDLAEMAREMVALYQPAADEAGVTLSVTGDARAVVPADPTLMRRALANLLDNAVSHLKPGSRVQVSTKAIDGTVLLRVSDDGPGFPPELAGQAFERFVKGPQSQGYGVGLSLVRAAARAHGGEAGLETAPGRGATISVTLPRAEPGSAARTPADPDPPRRGRG